VTEPLRARLALSLPYQPSEGDRVLVAFDGAEYYVVGVLHAAQEPTLELSDGARVGLSDGALELRDGAGRTLLRYAAGRAELFAPSGDLSLEAPHGRVLIRSGTDVQIEAQRDLGHRVGRRLAVQVGAAEKPQLGIEAKSTRVITDRLELEAKASRAVVGKATVLARQIATTANTLAHNVERYELTAKRLVEKTEDAFRDVSDLLQMRIGRMRTLVKDVHALYSRRTVMVSKDDTSIDGKRILLG